MKRIMPLVPLAFRTRSGLRAALVIVAPLLWLDGQERPMCPLCGEPALLNLPDGILSFTVNNEVNMRGLHECPGCRQPLYATVRGEGYTGEDRPEVHDSKIVWLDADDKE